MLIFHFSLFSKYILATPTGVPMTLVNEQRETPMFTLNKTSKVENSL